VPQVPKPIPFLVKDFFSTWPSFTAALYCALDYQILILFILLFSLFDRIIGSSIVSVAIIYIIEKMLSTLRATLSEGNISRKTLIDDRFLI
jgi:membrane protein implicated in regulation of membrane protease activity